MRNLKTLIAASALVMASATIGFAGPDAAVGAPGSNSTVTNSVAIVVAPDGSATVNGNTINVATLPANVQAAIAQVAAAGGATIQTTSPLVIGLLASYF